MNILNEEDAFVEAQMRYRFEGTKRYDTEKLDAFLDGFEFADKQIKHLVIEFAEFYHTVADLEKTYYGRDCKRLFELWLEEQTKK